MKWSARPLTSYSKAVRSIVCRPSAIKVPTVKIDLAGSMVSLPRFKLVAEAARDLRKRERWLRDWLKSHPVDRNGVAFYRLAGRTKLLSDWDIDRIRESLPCPLPSSRRN